MQQYLTKMDSDSQLNWNCEMEVNLLHALRGHKPVGVNRHFQMIFIHDKLSSTYKKITPTQIWDYLAELYDLQALNESEIVPFPNKELSFDLPENEYSGLMEKSFPRIILSRAEEPKSETKAEKADKHEKTDTGKSSKLDSRHSMGAAVLHTPDNSPKRKRTRHTPSSTASPATPDAPPAKRGRR